MPTINERTNEMNESLREPWKEVRSVRTPVKRGDSANGIEEEHGSHEDAEDLDAIAHHVHHEHLHRDLLHEPSHQVP